MVDAPWWSRERHSARRPALLARARVMSDLRAWFAKEGFTEVEPGALQRSPGNETHLHALEARWRRLDGQDARAYLHTSPEFAMKKLLSAGETRIFALARVFRGREAGPVNVNEFTMLEWYRAGAPYEDVIADTLALVRFAAKAAGGALTFRGRSISADAPAQRLTLAEAAWRFAGIDLLASLNEDGTGNDDALRAALAGAGLKAPADDTWSDLFSRLLAERIEPALEELGLVVLDEYPAPEAALARRTGHDRRVAERFEVYALGLELANGFGELTDAGEQRTRFEADMDEKARRYGERYPIDEEFLDALDQMPPAAGVALGFDRLVLLATGAASLADVMWTPPLPTE